jgi:phosphoribosylaminoimidazole-succinocarboxamide synthase
MGSVKDLEIIKNAGEEAGQGVFVFSDRYSVFDWGEMPDHIPHKGESLCLISAYFFEKLAEQGIKTHYQGIVEDGVVKSIDELQGPSARMEVSLVRVIKPHFDGKRYDYSVFNNNLINYLIPLEIIYRNTLPEHSSFRKRAESGEIDIKDYGLEELPPAGETLTSPIYDVSTKLEASDRYISWEEAREIAGLNEDEYQEILKILSGVNKLITAETERVGLKNLDGKIEMAFDDKRNLMVVDAIGTPDECRFSFNGLSISKEAIRKYYRESNWYQEVIRAKKTYDLDWQANVDILPGHLPPETLKMVSEMYMACANEITGRKWFDQVRPLSEIPLPW